MFKEELFFSTVEISPLYVAQGLKVDFTFICSTLSASKISCLKSIKISILLVYYLLHNPFWLQLVLTLFQYFIKLCLAKDHWRGFNIRNARMVHIVNYSILKWCIHLVEVYYLYNKSQGTTVFFSIFLFVLMYKFLSVKIISLSLICSVVNEHITIYMHFAPFSQYDVFYMQFNARNL